MNTISLIENNKVERVEFSTLEKLADFYEVKSVADLLEFSDQPRSGKRTPGLAGISIALSPC